MIHDEKEEGQEEGSHVIIPDRPRLEINHIGVSGGKDSTALALWAVHESGYDPASIDITFCDTGNEHPLTYEAVARLSEHVQKFGVRAITRLTSVAFMLASGRPGINGYYELAKWKGRFPGVKTRFCTQFLKIFPTQYYLECLVALLGCRVVLHSGVRAAESVERAKLVMREPKDTAGFFEEYRPLLRWSIEDVWAIHKRYGVEPNPLYAMGAKRVGCLPCIMSRKSEIANIAERWPERIDMIRVHERDFDNPNGISTFFPRKTIPIRFRSKKITTAKGVQMVVCTIDDVVRWATEKPEYHTPNLPMTELNTAAEDRTACQSTWGSCE